MTAALTPTPALVTQRAVQRLAMWVLWTLFDGRRVYTEAEVNQILKAANAFDFGDLIMKSVHAFRDVERAPPDLVFSFR